MRKVMINNLGTRAVERLLTADTLDYNSPWIFSDAQIDELMKDGIDNIRGICLGKDLSIENETKEKYLFPVIHGGKLYRSALILAKERATHLGYDSVADKAGILLDRIHGIRNKESESHEPDEFRSVEIRGVDETEGTFQAYAVIWEEVDSFGTRFKRGAFRKTIRERLSKGNVKILWQHDIKEPIGLVERAVEDEVGLLITGKLDIGVTRADQARQQMQSGTINQFSFGFDIVRQKRNDDGFIDISEVKWWEASPVTFGANENTSVVNVRSMFDKRQLEKVYNEDRSIIEEKDGGITKKSEGERAEDFDETIQNSELSQRGWVLMEALWRTIDDIWWGSEKTGEDLLNQIDIAIEKFHAAYVDWVSELVSKGLRSAPHITNILAKTFKTEFEERGLESIAQESNMSLSELEKLHNGELLSLSARGRLKEFNFPLFEAHLKQRNTDVLSLLTEIRQGGFSAPEIIRMKALLSVQDGGTVDCRCHEVDTNNSRNRKDDEPANQELLDGLDNLSKAIKKE